MRLPILVLFTNANECGRCAIMKLKREAFQAHDRCRCLSIKLHKTVYGREEERERERKGKATKRSVMMLRIESFMFEDALCASFARKSRPSSVVVSDYHKLVN